MPAMPPSTSSIRKARRRSFSSAASCARRALAQTESPQPGRSHAPRRELSRPQPSLIRKRCATKGGMLCERKKNIGLVTGCFPSGAARARRTKSCLTLFSCSKGGWVPILLRPYRALEDGDEIAHSSRGKKRQQSRRQAIGLGIVRRSEAHLPQQEIGPEEVRRPQERRQRQEACRQEGGAGQEARHRHREADARAGGPASRDAALRERAAGQGAEP